MKKLVKIASALLAVMLLVVVVAGCAAKSEQKAPDQTANQAKPVSLTVSSAASLKGAMTDIKGLYTKQHPNVTLTLNFDSSGALQQQIEQGAPADLFFSAAAKQMDALDQKGLLQEGTRKDLLSNKLVLIVPTDSTKDITFKDLANADVKKIAIGDPASVPCGTYAQNVFKNLGIDDKVKSKLILGKDVTQVLTYVAGGDVDAGIVYLSESKNSSKVKVVDTAAVSLYTQPVYPVAVIKSTKNLAAAKDFENFLFSDQAKAVYQKYSLVVLGE